MKRLLLLLVFLVACTPVHREGAIRPISVGTDGPFVNWSPKCRHFAIYWASMVGEEYEVRVALGNLWNVAEKEWQLHVQPQIHLGSTWYYFTIEKDTFIFIHYSPREWEFIESFTFLEYAERLDRWQWKEEK